ncbi:MAG TPA: hypothetical protein VEY95_06185 [Azospirillaceae bacterium]|nr:hypothetical protein [Azospirillaceae bacterium]
MGAWYGQKGGRRAWSRLLGAVAALTLLGACGSDGARRVDVAAPQDPPSVRKAFDRERAGTVAGLAREAAARGRPRDALQAYAAAIEQWPADAGLWSALADQYEAVGRPEGRDYARFFAARMDIWNALHPRAAAASLDGMRPPDAAKEPSLRQSYVESAALLARFYRGQYEDVREVRVAEERARIPFYEPYLAYPAALAGAGAVFGSFFQFARGLSTEANAARR